MEREEYLNAKRYQLELIFLGFALCSAGDRKKALSEMGVEDLSSPVTRACYDAILRKDRGDVRDAFNAITPVDEGLTILESLIGRIKGMERDRSVKEYLASVLAETKIGTVEDIRERLQAALAYVSEE